MRINKYITYFVFSLLSFTSNAQTGKYDVSKIGATLLVNANIVTRERSYDFTVSNIDKANLKVVTAQTLLNNNAKDALLFTHYTDKFNSLSKINIEVFDAKGASVKKYSKKDLSQQSTGEGLVPDGKLHYIQLQEFGYPITIKLEYEINYNGILNYPVFEIQTPNESIEYATFKATVPLSLDLRYKVKNVTPTASQLQKNNEKIYNWEVANLPAFTYENNAVSKRSRYPQIIIAPNKFQIDDYAGDMSSWQSFGNWYNALTKESNNLSEPTKEYLKKLVQPFSTQNEKINAVYKYLQNNFRYVSIQLGIGGLKPFSADFVDKKKYGDCKALANYMQAALGAVGIKSYQALINAGYNEEPVDAAFPVNHFNHVILCVPSTIDTTWLECTSSTSDFGVLGNFTENRNALLITENGGVLVSTPLSKANANTSSTNISIEIQKDGSAKATINMVSYGEEKQKHISNLINSKRDEQKIYLVDEMNYAEPTNFSVVITNTNKINITANFDKVYDFATGNYIFINPRLYKLWATPLPNYKLRKLDYYFEYPFSITDTTHYILPKEMKVNMLPKNIQIKIDDAIFFTKYEYVAAQHKVIVTAQLSLYQYKIKAEKYAAIKQFFDEVILLQSEKIVLTKL